MQGGPRKIRLSRNSSVDNVLRQILILTANFRARLWASMYNFIAPADLATALQAKYCSPACGTEVTTEQRGSTGIG